MVNKTFTNDGGFEPQTSGVGSDPFANWATTTARPNPTYFCQ